MVSTVWSVSCLLFFYSRCPPCPTICKSGGTCPPVPYGVGATDDNCFYWNDLLSWSLRTSRQYPLSQQIDEYWQHQQNEEPVETLCISLSFTVFSHLPYRLHPFSVCLFFPRIPFPLHSPFHFFSLFPSPKRIRGLGEVLSNGNLPWPQTRRQLQPRTST